MITMLESSADVVAARIDGRLTRDDLETYISRIESALEANEKTHLFAEIGSLDSVDTDDFGSHVRRWFALLGKLDRFGRIAVVSDKAWLRWAARIESALLPYVHHETFVASERDIALAWVKGDRDRPHGPSISIIETSSPDVMGFEVDGSMTAEELRAASDHFNAALAEGRPRRMVGRIRRIGGFDPASFLDGATLAMKRGMFRQLERYALIGGPAWLRAWVSALDPWSAWRSVISGKMKRRWPGSGSTRSSAGSGPCSHKR